MNLPQISPPAADKISYERNHDCLKSEYKKPNTNHSVMKKLLQLTHETRRVEISSCQVSLAKIIEKFPFFSSKIWVRFDVIKLASIMTFLDRFLLSFR